jgi:hypothetical protein
MRRRTRDEAPNAGDEHVTSARRSFTGTLRIPVPQPTSSSRAPRVTFPASSTAPWSGNVHCSWSCAQSNSRTPSSAKRSPLDALILATQMRSRLDRLTDAQRTRDLPAGVVSNLDGLLDGARFHTSAEEARCLADEQGGDLDAQDLLELGHFACYARVTDMRSGERLPRFSVRVDLPAVRISWSAVTALARLSAEQHGRDALDVDVDLQSAMARVRGPQKPPRLQSRTSQVSSRPTQCSICRGAIRS